MIVPNKMTPLDDSILGKIGYLIVDNEHEMKLVDLLELRLRKFSDIAEFLLALDALYVLGKIDFDEKKGIIRYVG